MVTAEEGCQEETQKKKGREGGKPDEGREERNIGSEIAQEVVAGIKEEASVQDDAKWTAQRIVGQRVKQIRDCSQIENEEEEEEKGWQEEDQMAVQWDEEQKLEEMLERRRMEGNSLQLEVMQKAPELVVRERMSQGEEGKCTEEPKKMKIWSIEEMQGKPSSSLAVDTEEMRQWRGMSQEEMDQCWKNLAEEEVLDKHKVEESKREESAQKQKYRIRKWREDILSRWVTGFCPRDFASLGVGCGRPVPVQGLPGGASDSFIDKVMECFCSFFWNREAQKQEIQNKKVVRRLLGQNLRFVWRIQLAASAEQAEGANGRGRDEAAAKNGDYERSNMEKSNQKEEWMLRTDGASWNCWRKTVGQRGSIQDGKIPCRSGKLVGGDEKKEEKEKIEEMHQHKVAQMIKSAEGSAGLLHNIA